MIHPETGRVHTSFNQVVAATGRLSSSDPNLQNIPIRTDEGREIRSAFVAGPARLEAAGRRLLADRAAHPGPLLGRRRRCAPPSTATKTSTRSSPARSSACRSTKSRPPMRRSAKAVNFGVIYGQSPFGLAKGLGISQEEAAKFIDGYFATLPRRRRVHAPHARRLPPQGLRLHDPRPPPRDPRRPPADKLSLGTEHPAAARSTCPSAPPSTPSSKAPPPT